MKKIMFFIAIIVILFTSCTFPSRDFNWEDMEYNQIPYSTFNKLSYSLQYKIKYKHDSDSILTFKYKRKDTLYLEDGTMNKVINVTDTFYLYLKKDSIIYRPVYSCKKPKLSFSTYEDFYDKTNKDFTSHFSFDFKYSKKDKYYYILKDNLPTLDTTSFWGTHIKYIDFENIPAKYSDYALDTYNRDYSFSFSESRILRKGSLGKYSNGKPCPEHDELILEENQYSKFRKWLTGYSKINVCIDW